MVTLVPVDAEQLVIQLLTAKMPGETIATDVSTRKRMITVEQVGGVRRGPVHDHPMIVIQAWVEKNRAAARDLCNEAFAHIYGAPNDPTWGYQIRSVTSIGGPHSFPDPETSCPRWQATVELNLRPVPLAP